MNSFDFASPKKITKMKKMFFSVQCILGCFDFLFGCSDSKEDEIGTKLFRTDNDTLNSDLLETNHSQVSDTNFLPETISAEVPISNLSVRRDFYEDGSIKEEIELSNGVKDGLGENGTGMASNLLKEP